MAYRVSIGGKFVGEYRRLSDAHKAIDGAFGRLPDYGILRFRLFDTENGNAARSVLNSAIWDACCEDPKAFKMYLEAVACWRQWSRGMGAL
jgi:hypothetical protein